MRLACFSGYTCLVPFAMISVASSCLFLLFVSQYSTPLNKLEIFKKVRCFFFIYHPNDYLYPNDIKTDIYIYIGSKRPLSLLRLSSFPRVECITFIILNVLHTHLLSFCSLFFLIFPVFTSHERET